MRAVLLGPDGQLGHDVRRAHVESGEAVDLIPLARRALDVTVPGDVERVLGGLKFDALVNCAAYCEVDEAEDRPDRAFAANAHAVRAMARVCAVKRARFVHVSTDYVFGGNRTQRQPLREHDPIAPINVYGASKAMGETLARLEFDDVVVLRVASLFGAAGARGRGDNFVETVIRAANEKRALRVVDDQTMSPTAAADVARIMMRLLQEGCEPGLFHVVNAGSATWFDFAREIVRRTPIAATVAPCASSDRPMRAERPRYSALDNARVSAAFGAMPPWHEALERYLRTRGHAT